MKKLVLLILALFVTGVAAADSNYPASSLYQLSAQLTNQSAQVHGLDVYEGHPVLVTLFYGSCSHTCPLLIETARSIDRAAADPNLRVLMISIDPDHDTPEFLSKLARERRIDTTRWTLARADAQNVRKIAAALSIQYRQTPDGEFNHASIITLLTPAGEIAHQSSTLGKADEALVAALRAHADEQKKTLAKSAKLAKPEGRK